MRVQLDSLFSESVKKYYCTIVQVGHLSFEGLMFEDGSFGIAQQQIASLFSVLPKSIYKLLQRLLGKDFQFFSVKTNRPKQAGKQNRAEKALTLVAFEKVLRKLDREGNQLAQEIVDEMIGLSLQQLFSDAFGRKFEKEERQGYLINRQQGIFKRKELTSVIKQWCDKHGVPEKVTGYSVYCSDQLNLLLFGAKSKELKQKFGVNSNSALRDKFSSTQLKEIEKVEDRLIEYVLLDDLKPTDAIKLIAHRWKQTHNI